MFALNTAVRNSPASISEGIEEYMEDRAGLKELNRNLYSNWVSKALPSLMGPGTIRKYYELDQVPLPDQLLYAPPELQTSYRKFVVLLWRQDAMKRRVKERAASMNLVYWPALLWWAEDGRRVDPICFKSAENILSRKYGLWSPSEGSHGGWDYQEYYGISPRQVAGYWKAAGCCDSPKYQWMVMNRKEIPKGRSLRDHLHIQRSQRWIEKNFNTEEDSRRLIFSTKALRCLGKLSPALRWAAVHGVTNYPVNKFKQIRIADLNWSAVKEVQVGPKWKRGNYAPSQVQWQLLGYVAAPTGLGCTPPSSASIPVFKGILTDLCTGTLEGVALAALNVAVWRLAQVWRSKTRALRYVERWFGDNPDRAIALHDAGQCPELPSGVKIQQWLALAEKFGPEVLAAAGAWEVVEKKLGGVPSSLTQLRKELSNYKYLHICSSEAEVGMLNRMLGEYPAMGEKTASHYLRFLRHTPAKMWETLPQVRVTGSDIGLEGEWKIEKLDHDDPVGPMLGLVTNCCQHLDGAGSECAVAGYSLPWSAFYVWRYRGKIVAQSWAWRGTAIDGVKGEVVTFDSIEALSGAYVEGIADLLVEAAKQIISSSLGIKEVRLGKTGYGITGAVQNRLTPVERHFTQAFPEGYVGYMDGSYQEIIAEWQPAE